MPSPDVTPYKDLRLLDRDPQDVVEGALAALQAYLPEWEPREGQTEVLLLEALALEVSEAIFTINRVPSAVVEVLLRLFQLERDEGAPPTANLRFTLSDAAGHVLPSGLRVALSVEGSEPVIFTTTEQVEVPAGTSTVTVTAIGDRFTAEVNGDQRTPLQFLDAVLFVERVELDGTVAGGAAEETDEAWFNRAVSRLGRLAETLVLPRHFELAALEWPGVTRAVALDNYNHTAETGTVGQHPGHITVAVYGAGGLVPTAERQALQEFLRGQAQANLGVWVGSPTVTPVNVTASVVLQAGASLTAVREAVTRALAGYLSPETWSWRGTVYRNELISLIDRVEGVDRVADIVAPAADFRLLGTAPLASLGTVTITQVAV